MSYKRLAKSQTLPSLRKSNKNLKEKVRVRKIRGKFRNLKRFQSQKLTR